MTKKFRWLIPTTLALLALLALPADAAVWVVMDVMDALEWIQSSHIADWAVAANAFTLTP